MLLQPLIGLWLQRRPQADAFNGMRATSCATHLATRCAKHRALVHFGPRNAGRHSRGRV